METAKGQLPNALIVGPMKAGTSWIQDYMVQRGDVCLPSQVKETFFFDHYYSRGTKWYKKHFKGARESECTVCLEIGASYFHHPDVPNRVRDALGEVPLLMTLRDPVARAWSHYLHLRRYGYTNASLGEAVKHFPEILEASRYRTSLERWYSVFPEDCIHIVWQDQLVRSPQTYAKEVCLALGITYQPVPEALLGPSNEASIPFSSFLAALGDRTAHFFRGVGLYSIVNVAKRMGLKHLFFGKPGSATGLQPTAEERLWLDEQLLDEIPPEAENRNRPTPLKGNSNIWSKTAR